MRDSSLRQSTVLAVLPALAVVAGAQTGRSERINAPVEGTVENGDVFDFQTTVDGNWVVYRAQQDETLTGLYAAPIGGTAAPTRISAPGAQVDAFRLSPANLRLAYLLDGALYRASPLSGSVALHPGASVGDFEISPNGQRVVYMTDSDGDGRSELHSVSLFGTPSPVLLSTAPVQGEIFSFEIAPDSTRVVFHADASIAPVGPFELFVAPIDGSAAPVALCGAFVGGGNVVFDGQEPTYDISPDSARVVYRANQLSAGKVELFSVPLDASAAPVRLNANLVSGGNVVAFRTSPDGTRVAYRADQTTNDRFDVHGVPIDGLAAPVRLNGVERAVQSLRMSPDGTRVAYVASPNGDGHDQIYVAPLDGSASSLQVSAEVQLTQLFDYEFTPDAGKLVYRAGNYPVLYAAPADASAPPVRLDLPQPYNGAKVLAFRIGADGNRLVYTHEVLSATSEVYALTIDGAQAPTRVHAASAPGVTATAVQLVGARVLYMADRHTADTFELCSAPHDASAPERVLNGLLLPTQTTTTVTGFALSPDGTRAVYTTGLGAVALAPDGGGPVALTLPSTGFGLPFRVPRFSADSARVFFLGWSVGSQLFCAPADGSELARQLSTGSYAYPFGASSYFLSPDGLQVSYSVATYSDPSPVYIASANGSTSFSYASSGNLLSARFTADSTRIVFLANVGYPYFNGPVRMYKRALDGSPPVEVAPFAPSSTALTGSFALTPDDAFVVYTRDEAMPAIRELYRAPLDNSAPPILLSGDPGAGLGLLWGRFLLTPDGQRALYAADRDGDGANELCVVPVDGSAPPLELSGTIVAGSGVAVEGSTGPLLVWVTPDGSRVVYVADALVTERFDLFSAPLDGSSAPVLLTQLAAGGDVELTRGAVRITADGTHAVLRADARSDERYELFSAALDGSTGQVPLSGTLVAGGDVAPGFVVVAEPPAVLFLADGATDERFELWLAPLDGGQAPTRRSFLAHAAADVQPDFQLAPDGGWVYYRADALVDERVELYRFPVERAPRALRR